MNERHKIPEIMLGVMLTVAVLAVYAVIGWVPSWWKSDVINPERASDFYTMIGAIANFALAAFAAWQIWRSIIADRDTRARFEAEHRPWLSVRLKDVKIALDRSYLVLSLDIKNVGNMVATDVEVRAEYSNSFLYRAVDIGIDHIGEFVRNQRVRHGHGFSRRLISHGESETVLCSLQLDEPKNGRPLLVQYAAVYRCSDQRHSVYCTAGDVSFWVRLVGADEEIYENASFNDQYHYRETKFEVVESPRHSPLYAD